MGGSKLKFHRNIIRITSSLASASKFKCPFKTTIGSVPVSFTLFGCSITPANCPTSVWQFMRRLELVTVVDGAAESTVQEKLNGGSSIIFLYRRILNKILLSRLASVIQPHNLCGQVSETWHFEFLNYLRFERSGFQPSCLLEGNNRANINIYVNYLNCCKVPMTSL